ncbi:MAG: ABC transporter ATP-binding protein [Candidatus Odinarchaeota archaeon]
MSQFVIETQGLSKAYGDLWALKSLDLRVPKNSIFAFLGPNGAGKTTAIKLLLGLTAATEGGGYIFGMDIARQSNDIRGRIGYLAQHPRFYDYMTARETLRFAARFYYSGPKETIEKRIQELLTLVNLDDKADRTIKGYSGGETQRLGIAQALINSPELLILDEPASGLDPQGREEVLDLMEQLQKTSTIFYSTHILDDVQRVSDSVAIINKGTLVAQAPINQLLSGTEGVAYVLTIEGDYNRIASQLESLPYVTAVSTKTENETAHFVVTIDDETKAKKDMLRTVLTNKDVIVTEFGRRKYELEEVFLRLVEEKKDAE